MNTQVYLGMIFWAVFYGAGEYFSKVWSIKPTSAMTALVISCYALSVVAWLPALRAHGSLSILSTIFALIGLLSGAIIGIFVFNEPITTRQYIGIGLAIVATILLC